MTRISDSDILAALDGAKKRVPVHAVPSALRCAPGDLPAAPLAVRRSRADALRAELAAMQSDAPVAGVSRLAWPDQWFSSGDPGEARACRRLWCDVLRAGIADAVAGWADRVPQSVSAGAAFEAASAAGWRAEMGWIGTSEFATVCRLAGLDPDAVVFHLRRGLRDRGALDGIARRFQRWQEARGKRDRSGSNGA